MKKSLFLSILPIALSSLSMQAMLFESPEGLHKTYSSLPLNSIERQLVINEIERRGTQLIKNDIHEAQSKGLLTILEINNTFFQHEAQKNPLVKSLFDEIKTKEECAKKHSEKTLPHNYLGLGTRYFLTHNNNAVRIHAKLFNSDELQSLINSQNE